MNDKTYEILEADSKLIIWLLTESGVSRSQISKDLDISESTLSRIVNKVTPLVAINFGYASKLTKYAEKLKV